MTTQNLSVRAAQGIVAIVDDDEASRKSLEFLLTVLGRRPKAYPSAQAFLNDAMEVFGCLLLDQHMPVMTGLELARYLRSMRNPIPIMLISGGMTPHLRERAIEIGVDVVCDKPPEPAMIVDFVDRALELQP